MRPLPFLLPLAACAGDASLPHSSPTDPTAGWEDTADEPWDVPWEEGCNPLNSAGDCLLPFPSAYFTTADASSATGVRLAYDGSAWSGPDGDLPVDPAIFNFADGVSPVTPLLVSFGRDVDPSFLSGWGEQGETVEPGAPIVLLNAETGETVPILAEMDQTNREWEEYAGRNPLIIRPLAPMEMGARYVAVLTADLLDESGQPFESPPVFVALRDSIETDDAVVEGMRDRYEELFAAIEAAGWSRDGLLLAWEVQVASEDFVLGPALSMRDQALDAIENNGISYVIEEVKADPNANAAWVVKGTFQPPGFLTADNDLERAADDEIVLQEDWPSYDFTMVVPPQAKTEGGLPLVVIGHGLFGNGEWMLDSSTAEEMIQPIAAEAGAVLVATDWIGLSNGDLDLILSEVVPDITRITIITDRLVQSHVNTLSLVELVLGDLPDDPAIGRTVEDPLVDPERIYYYGVSLGGIQGAGQVALSERISRATLAVPGAGWSHMMQRSTNFSELETLIDALYPDPLAQNVFLAGLQTYFDFSDPANLATMLRDDPDKVVVIQEAIGDCQVPNLATDLLSRTIGAAHLEVATDPVWGLETISGPTTKASLTQIRVPDDLAAYFPPEDNTIPETDNGVHNDAVLQEAALWQAQHLYETGEIVHPCDGECDPD